MKEELKINIRVVDIGGGEINIEDKLDGERFLTLTPTEACYLLGILEARLKQ